MESAIKEVIRMSLPTLVIVVTILLIMRVTLYFKSDRSKICIHEELFGLCFVVYLLILFQLVTSQDMVAYGGTNFIPFREILRYDPGTEGFYRQVLGNIILFIPFGYFVTSYCKIKDLGTITLVSFLSSLVIEVTQRFIGRSFDVDDILLNVVGGIIGFLLYIGLSAIKNHLPKFLRKDWIYNVLSITLIVLGIIYVIKIL